MAEENFSDIGRVGAIARLYEGTPFRPFEDTGFEASAQGVIRTRTRIFLEGIDFNLVYFPLKHLGYKMITAVTGELYAGLSRPRTLALRLGVSAKLDFAQVRELWSGAVAAAKEHGYKAMDLDLVPSVNGLTASVSATGETPCATERRRPEPQSKDLLCVSGNLGGAFFGMKILEREMRRFDEEGTHPALEKYRMMVASYLKPEITPGLPALLEDADLLPSCGCLVTGGLAEAVKRIARTTGLGAKVYADKIPFEGNSFELGREMNIDPISAAMNGGEDYRLLFAVPILKMEKFRRDFQTFDIIGHLARPDVGTVLVSPDGVEFPLKAQGWED